MSHLPPGHSLAETSPQLTNRKTPWLPFDQLILRPDGALSQDLWSFLELLWARAYQLTIWPLFWQLFTFFSEECSINNIKFSCSTESGHMLPEPQLSESETKLIFHTLLSAANFLQIYRVPHQVWVLHIKFGCFRITFRCFATDFTISHQIWPFCMPCVLISRSFPVRFPFVSRHLTCAYLMYTLRSVPVRFLFVSRQLTCEDLLHTHALRVHFPFVSRSFPAKLACQDLLRMHALRVISRLFFVRFPFVSRSFPVRFPPAYVRRFASYACLASLIPVRFPFVSRRLTCADLLHTQTLRTHFPFMSRSFPAKLACQDLLRVHALRLFPASLHLQICFIRIPCVLTSRSFPERFPRSLSYVHKLGQCNCPDIPSQGKKHGEEMAKVWRKTQR